MQFPALNRGVLWNLPSRFRFPGIAPSMRLKPVNRCQTRDTRKKFNEKDRNQLGRPTRSDVGLVAGGKTGRAGPIRQYFVKTRKEARKEIVTLKSRQ
jgi:hypothetical protein